MSFLVWTERDGLRVMPPESDFEHLADQGAVIVPERLAKKASLMYIALQDLVNEAECLIADSGGVYGLHANGEGAPWDSLCDGGEFEEWLSSLSTDSALVSEINKE